jgi:hypothetical protein
MFLSVTMETAAFGVDALQDALSRAGTVSCCKRA